MAEIVVLGGGWAGIACAVELRKRRALDAITVLEASPQLGGRARSLDWQLPEETLRIDNGQHMLLGVYRETLALIQTLGVSVEHVFERKPLNLRTRFGIDFQASQHPAPWHLALGGLHQRGLAVRDKWSLLRMAFDLKRRRFVLPNSMSVAQWIRELAISHTVAQHMLRPLCLAALNTPLEKASARVFAAILRDSIAASARDSDFLVAREPLGRLVPEPAARYFEKNAIQWKTGSRAVNLSSSGRKYLVDTQEKSQANRYGCDSVVVALPLQSVSALVASPATPIAGGDLPFEAIATVYLYWSSKGAANLSGIEAHQPLMLNDLETDSPGQWFFNLGRTPKGGQLASVVVSAIDLDAPERLRGKALGETVANQLHRQLGLSKPQHIRVITEKRATFQAAAGSQRAGTYALSGQIPGVFLAGDYTIADYPATLESAVRSGKAAAQAVDAYFR